MASPSETSYWINFFTSSGIPAGDATHYAIIFSDNRITRDMLLDLSKEYLTDMGISRLGDVISILKHAKQVYHQEAQDKVMQSAFLPVSSSNSSSTPPSGSRRSTAASRMVNHFTSKHPEAAPMSQSPVPKLPPPDPPKSKRKVSVFERLGADDPQETVSLPTKGSPSPSSVFSRLGGKSAMKRAASATSLEDLDGLVNRSPSLPYVGVLKTPDKPSPTKKAHMDQPQMRIKNIVKTVTVEEEKASNIQRPEISTTTQGVLSDFAKRDSLSLKDRLGGKKNSALPKSTTAPSKTLPKFMVTARAKAKVAKATSVQKRLGPKKVEAPSSPVVSSSQTKPSAKAKKKGLMSEAMAKPSGGVFSRLGTKTS